VALMVLDLVLHCVGCRACCDLRVVRAMRAACSVLMAAAMSAAVAVLSNPSRCTASAIVGPRRQAAWRPRR
jgi:hypothetical protein